MTCVTTVVMEEISFAVTDALHPFISYVWNPLFIITLFLMVIGFASNAVQLCFLPNNNNCPRIPLLPLYYGNFLQ